MGMRATYDTLPAQSGVVWTGQQAETLIAAARAATGLQQFGDQNFLPGIHMMLSGLEREARPNQTGLERARLMIMIWLKNKLWANACFETFPAILERKITAPIVVVGPARSGTTRLQRMLAADPRLQHLTAWEGFNPAPRGGEANLDKWERHGEIKVLLDQRRQANPEAYAAHPMDADWAEEETLLLNHSFCGFFAFAHFNMPSYRTWYLANDKADSYRYMGQLLRLIAWSRSASEEHPWILKAPPHMLALHALMQEFPDARLIFTHRDPVKTTASTLSLMWSLYRQNTDTPSRYTIRDTWLPLCEKMVRDCMQARECISAAQQLDVHYDEMSRDWRIVMRRIYEFIGLPFDSSAEARVATWLTKSDSENHHGAHHYCLEQFGLTPSAVRTQMNFYSERFAIPAECGNK